MDWDGTSWTFQNTPGADLEAVSCTSPAACTAVGNEYNNGFTLPWAEGYS